MRQRLFFWRCILAIPGIALLLTSAVLLGTGVFGSWQFVWGLAFHLVGQGCCIGSMCLPAWLQLRHIRRNSQTYASSSLNVNSIRVARFRPEAQIVRLLSGASVVVLLGVWLVAGAVGLRNLLRLREYGVTTNAAITGTSFREGGALLTVTYAFSVPKNLPVADTFRAPQHLLPTLRTGNLLPITYLPSNPNVHTWQRVDNGFVARQCLSGVAVFTTFMAYAGLPLLWAERRLRRQLRLARVGIGVTGAIVVCKPLLWRKTRRGYLLTYSFATPNRQVFFGRALVPCIADEPTLPGFPLTVLYDPLYPSISLPLTAFHVVEMANVRKTVLAA